MGKLTKLNSIPFLSYKNENFIVDKFSGFTNVDFHYKFEYGYLSVKYTATRDMIWS
jgi:hypothetical protein